MAPANTGIDKSNKNAVMKIDQTNKGILYILCPGFRIFNIVEIKFIAPNIEAAPDKCKLKIAKSTAAPEWLCIALRGGYTVQPVPTPISTREEANNKQSDGGSNQKLILLRRGNAISGLPIMIGTNQLPKPPIKIGITIKKIIKKAWAVIKTLYSWWLPSKKWLPGCSNSIRINSDIQPPNTPEKVPKSKYRVPISLWFVENIHRKVHWEREVNILFKIVIMCLLNPLFNYKYTGETGIEPATSNVTN